jgi:hypothetical protein
MENKSEDDVTVFLRQHGDDVTIFEDFQEQWDAETLTGAHPVMSLVDYWAKVVAIKYDCVPQWMDIKDEALISLATESKYEGRCSLKNYVMRVLISKVSVVRAPLVRVPRKPKQVGDSGGEGRVAPRYVRPDDDTDEGPATELIDERSMKLPDRVLLRLAFDTEVRAKFEALPELPRTIVAIVEDHEERLGRRRLAEEATKRLGRNITRHQVNIALRLLAQIIGASLWWV